MVTILLPGSCVAWFLLWESYLHLELVFLGYKTEMRLALSFLQNCGG